MCKRRAPTVPHLATATGCNFFNARARLLKIRQKLLPKSLSDHNAVALEKVKINWDRKPYRCFNFWLEDSSFISAVKDAIKEVASANGSKRIAKLLFDERGAVIGWSKKQSFKSGIEELEQEISKVELDLQENGESQIVMAELRSLKCRLYQGRKILAIEIEGDRDTSFFSHNFASARRRCNSMLSMVQDGRRIDDPAGLKRMIHSYFQSVYNKKVVFSEEEIFQAYTLFLN
ncbi:uncharacterized protein LOC120215049 [Hibiscus syriacus]|uniref:uncharacterized protein LOC120215049 n=1 Tax=Hibiscus syriacus TaxID=106335 RepID=UPI00192084E0|nr:uncharacterized protein LOC120215049 [Hibiscus syriacus]